MDAGQKDATDYLHFARPFPKEQLDWIRHTKEGQSSFDQPIEYQPGYYDEHGNKVVNKGAYMGNKYRRLVWDKVYTQETIYCRVKTQYILPTIEC